MQEEEELHGEKMLTEFNVKRRTKALGKGSFLRKTGVLSTPAMCLKLCRKY